MQVHRSILFLRARACFSFNVYSSVEVFLIQYENFQDAADRKILRPQEVSPDNGSTFLNFAKPVGRTDIVRSSFRVHKLKLLEGKLAGGKLSVG